MSIFTRIRWFQASDKNKLSLTSMFQEKPRNWNSENDEISETVSCLTIGQMNNHTAMGNSSDYQPH